LAREWSRQELPRFALRLEEGDRCLLMSFGNL